MHFGSTKWIVIAYSTGIYIGIDKCFGPPISPGPGEIPPPPPLSVGLDMLLVHNEDSAQKPSAQKRKTAACTHCKNLVVVVTALLN